MTLTYAQTMEAAVEADPVKAPMESDPVTALMGAHRDGLLRYHGFVSGHRYEIEIGSRRWKLPARDALETVDRLRAVQHLSLIGAEVSFGEIDDVGRYVLNDRGWDVRLDADQVVDWCEGYTAAHLAVGEDHAGEDQLGQIAELLEHPSRDDQCRLVILGLMYGRGANKMTTDELAHQTGKSKKTVVDALAFGGPLTSDMAEKMIGAFGLRWSVTAQSIRPEPARSRRSGAQQNATPPEMPGIAVLRRILAAARAGWLRYVDEPAPNKARRKPERSRRYAMSVGARYYHVDVDGIDSWLAGLTAFHREA